MSLIQKNAVVTGSTSGIGLAIATALCQAGANVMLNGLGDENEINETIARLKHETGAKVVFSNANMMDPNQIEQMIFSAQDELGSVDILVNNAGIQYVSPIESFPIEKWDAIIAINMSSAFHASRVAIPIMKNNKWGRIINTASAHALVASPFKSAYVTAKHGLAGLTKTIALEVAEYGITANAIAPGYVKTPLVEGQIAETAKARGITPEQVKNDVMLKAQPTKEFVTVEQIGALSVFLCSDQGASINGAILPVDGGWTAQ